MCTAVLFSNSPKQQRIQMSVYSAVTKPLNTHTRKYYITMRMNKAWQHKANLTMTVSQWHSEHEYLRLEVVPLKRGEKEQWFKKESSRLPVSWHCPSNLPKVWHGGWNMQHHWEDTEKNVKCEWKAATLVIRGNETPWQKRFLSVLKNCWIPNT